MISKKIRIKIVFKRFLYKYFIKNIHVALNNTRNGEIVSWHNGERLSSGDVRVVSTYYKKTGGYCRIFQSYIKLNGAEKHTTKNVCKVNNVWQF